MNGTTESLSSEVEELPLNKAIEKLNNLKAMTLTEKLRLLAKDDGIDIFEAEAFSKLLAVKLWGKLGEYISLKSFEDTPKTLKLSFTFSYDNQILQGVNVWLQKSGRIEKAELIMNTVQ